MNTRKSLAALACLSMIIPCLPAVAGQTPPSVTHKSNARVHKSSVKAGDYLNHSSKNINHWFNGTSKKINKGTNKASKEVNHTFQGKKS